MAVHISSSMVIGSFPEIFPLTHARIGYRNIVRTADVTVSGTSPETSFLSLQNDFTNEAWEADSLSSTVTIDAGSAQRVDYTGIASHNLGSAGHVVSIEYSFDATNWVLVNEFTPVDDSPTMSLFSRISARYWRINISGGSEPAQIAILYFGEALAMQRPIYGGHGPITLNRSITKREAVTESGQFVGNVVVRRGVTATYSWNNLTAAWYRSDFDPFALHALSKPFFIAWRPEPYPQEVAFGMAVDQPSPQNIGTRDLMSVSMQVRGLVA